MMARTPTKMTAVVIAIAALLQRRCNAFAAPLFPLVEQPFQ